MIIKDAMVVIHLAKITLLEKSCEYFGKTVIPHKVYQEIIKGKDKGHSEVNLIEELIENKKISMKKVRNKDLLKKVREFNIQRGEGESVALYWQENADFLASDDGNIRKKRMLLNIKVIGTIAIVLKLYEEKMIDKEKFVEGLTELKKIGWFNDSIINKVLRRKNE